MVHLKDILTPEMMKNIMKSKVYEAQEGQGTSQTGFKNVTYNGKNSEHMQLKYNMDNTPYFVGLLPSTFFGKSTAELCGRMVEFARVNKCMTTQELADKLCKDKTINPNGIASTPIKVTPMKSSGSSSGKGKSAKEVDSNTKLGKSIKKTHKMSKANGSKAKKFTDVDFDDDDEDIALMSADDSFAYIKSIAKQWKSLGWIADTTYDTIKGDIKESYIVHKRSEMAVNSDSDSD
jgi:hypothetical protein